jgi:NAD-dependent dihydropyrimidine dehydrogenase PreA subunit
MSFVITDSCVKDFLCVDECATGAIAPALGNPAAKTASQVYINPDICIDCGSCAAACEHDAIHPEYELSAEKAGFAESNRAYFI